MARERLRVALICAKVSDLLADQDVVQIDLARLDRVDNDAEVDAEVARARSYVAAAEQGDDRCVILADKQQQLCRAEDKATRRRSASSTCTHTSSA